eukprot:364289-Chlamydomonas_euryale.AAC.13
MAFNRPRTPHVAAVAFAPHGRPVCEMGCVRSPPSAAEWVGQRCRRATWRADKGALGVHASKHSASARQHLITRPLRSDCPATRRAQPHAARR